MRTSQYLLATLKEIPTDTEMISHKLMLRAGMIRKLVSGLYIWLPTGLRVLRKIENIVREEMNKSGAIEISMPIVQPAELWHESERFSKYGSELLKFTDRSKRQFILGPTHEEVITDLIRKEISSYKQLPLNLYQIHTKFRDEIRPCYGVIRSREFIMKDAYSFHINQVSLQQTYDIMYQTYSTIFTRLGLKFRVVQGENGSIGGNISHEFQVLIGQSNNNIVSSATTIYTDHIKFKQLILPKNIRAKPTQYIKLINTPTVRTIDELVKVFSIDLSKTVKTFIVHANDNFPHRFIALILRGDHQLNNIKAEKLPHIATPLTFASTEEIRIALGADPGSLGPVNMPLPIIIDYSVSIMSDFVAGSNIDGKYFFGINWERDVPIPEIADLREIIMNHIQSNNQKNSEINHNIEVGHIFQIGKKYSQAMKAMVCDEEGSNKILTMGCYGIGISRVIAATIEQNHDKNGILWPDTIAPFNVVILPINMHKSYRIQEVSENLYWQLQMQGIDVLFDDRKERPGIMFADMELIGVSHILVISDNNLNIKKVEYQNRVSGEKKIIKLDEIINFLISKIFQLK